MSSPDVAQSFPLHPNEAEALEGLLQRPRRLPPYLLYDARGSALFEAITELPEYYLTRTERALLAAHADEIVRAAGSPGELVELGAGTATKTRLLIDALLAQRDALAYHPIDVSAIALSEAESSLKRPGLTVRPLIGRYEDALPLVRALPRPRLVLFIGSSLGNYDPDEAERLLTQVHGALDRGDRLLVGVDLRKDPRLLLPAYDDAAGVTAAFNRNVLVRLNRELGCDFDLEAFRHVAVWNDACSRIEMHLESRARQLVRVPPLGRAIELQRGERIHTENSYKLTLHRQVRLFRRAGFHAERRWLDARRWYALHLLAASGGPHGAPAG